jgi:predicted AlkP superfamily phosphohydrolase/phosphomutase
MARPSLAVVGLDAATFDIIDPLVEAGQLPNLGKLMSRGARGPLRSTTHPLTPLAWSTLVTGVNAARHGIWDFTERYDDGYKLRAVNGSYRRAPAVWDRLSAAGRSVGIVNIPFTWPAPELNGFAIAGLDAASLEGGLTYPRELVRELMADFGRLDLDHRFPIGPDGEVDLDRVAESAKQKVDCSLLLVDRFDPDLLFVVFMSADHIHHLCWPEWERAKERSRVAEVYRILDRALGDLLAGLGDIDVLVVSDHGGGSLEGVVNLNAWLEEGGYLTYTEGGDRRSSARGRRFVYRAFELRHRLPKQLRYGVKQRLPGLRERIYELRQFSVIDWRHTRAFSYGTFGNVVINLRGREAGGIVEPGDEYERLRDELAERLAQLSGPQGQKIVKAVHKREDLFEGPNLDRIPDLIVEFESYAWLGKGTLRSRATGLWDAIEVERGSKAHYVGSHRHEGIIVLSGPSANSGARVSASIEDVAPTMLYLLGEPVPAELEGRVLTEAIAPAVLDARMPVYVDDSEPGVGVGAARPYDEAGVAQVEERLRDLGYLE